MLLAVYVLTVGTVYDTGFSKPHSDLIERPATETLPGTIDIRREQALFVRFPQGNVIQVSQKHFLPQKRQNREIDPKILLVYVFSNIPSWSSHGFRSD